MIVGTLEALFTIDSKQYTAGIKKIESSTRAAESSIKSAGASLVGFTAKLAAVGVGAIAAGVGVAKAALEIEAIQHKMRFATGGIKEADEAFSFLRGESERLGVSLSILGQEYGNFAASSKATALTTKEMQNIFTSVSEAAAVLRMSASATKLSFKALSQMMSKGVVQSEELKMQLGDHLPGAAHIMAKALGVTVKEMNKMMEQGELLAEEVLPLFAKALREDVALSLKELDESFSASVGRMKTGWYELKVVLLNESSLIMKALKFSVETMTGFMKVFSEGVDTSSLLGGTIQELERLPIVLGEQAAEVIMIEEEKQANLYQVDYEGMQKRINLHQQQFEIEKGLFDANAVKEIAAEKKLQDDIEKARYKAMQERATLQDEEFANEKAAFEARNSDILGFFDNTLDTTLGMMQTWAAGGELSFKDFADSIIKDMTKIIFKAMVAKPLMDSLRGFLDAGEQASGTGVGTETGGFLTKLIGFAGSALTGGGATKAFASGGVIDEPIAGIGLKSGTQYTFGEEGDEAIVPLNGRTEAATPFESPMQSGEGDTNNSYDKRVYNNNYDKSVTDNSNVTSDQSDQRVENNNSNRYDTTSDSNNNYYKRLFGDGPVSNVTNDNSEENITNNNADNRTSNTNNVNVTISAIDSKSITELMRNNPQAVTIPIIDALQGGDRGLTAAMRGTI